MSLVRYSVIALIVFDVFMTGAGASPGYQPDTSAAAEALLAKMEAAYETVGALHIKVKASGRYTGAGNAGDFPPPGPDTLELRVQRPNKLFLSAASTRDGDKSSFLVVSDGATLSCWRSWTNTIVQTKAPAALSGIARLLPDDIIGHGTSTGWEIQDIVEWDALATDSPAGGGAKDFMASGGRLTTTGPERVGGALVHVVQLTVPVEGMTLGFESRYYLDAESYLVRGLAWSARGKHPDNGRDFTADLQSRYELFSTKPAFSDADFRFVPPRGARPDKGR